MALLGSQGMDVAPNKKSQVSIIKLKEEDGGRKRQKFSRVLDEDIQSWMKKTTYLTNDQYRSVHQFKSLADTKKETADAVDKSYKELTESKLDPSSIDESFEFATNGMHLYRCKLIRHMVSLLIKIFSHLYHFSFSFLQRSLHSRTSFQTRCYHCV